MQLGDGSGFCLQFGVGKLLFVGEIITIGSSKHASFQSRFSDHLNLASSMSDTYIQLLSLHLGSSGRMMPWSTIPIGRQCVLDTCLAAVASSSLGFLQTESTDNGPIKLCMRKGELIFTGRLTVSTDTSDIGVPVL